jgi:hypothetical protein
VPVQDNSMDPLKSYFLFGVLAGNLFNHHQRRRLK